MPMDLNVENIFQPSVGVDLVFDMNSLTPYSRSSIIYDTDYRSRTVTIAQPLRVITRNTVFKELHLTTIINRVRRKVRVGIACNPIQFLKEYRLANFKKVQAIILEYSPPIREMNIRSAFRMPMSAKYIIKAKIIYNKTEYLSSKDFAVKDVSLTGAGLILPKKKGKVLNPLANIKLNDVIVMGMVLVNIDKKKPVGTVPMKTEVVRVNPHYSDTHTMVGLKISKLTDAGEDLLNKFIHDAQIDELKRLSGRNL